MGGGGGGGQSPQLSSHFSTGAQGSEIQIVKQDFWP